jgi:hypothetical protein
MDLSGLVVVELPLDGGLCKNVIAPLIELLYGSGILQILPKLLFSK